MTYEEYKRLVSPPLIGWKEIEQAVRILEMYPDYYLRLKAEQH